MWTIRRRDCVSTFTFPVQFAMGHLNPVQILRTRKAREAAFGALTPPYPAFLMPPPPNSPCPSRPYLPPPPEAAPPPPHARFSQRSAGACIHPAVRGQRSDRMPLSPHKCMHLLPHPRPFKSHLRKGAPALKSTQRDPYWSQGELVPVCAGEQR